MKKALAAIGADVFVSGRRRPICASARGIIVPGVGHFGATRALDAGWIEASSSASAKGRPLLGICLGMQWLFEGSDEAPDCPGLGLLAGRCYRLPGSEWDVVKIPHVGWNALALQRDGVDRRRRRRPARRSTSRTASSHRSTRDTVAVTEHGEPFAADRPARYVAGVQFHPEKSGEVGLAGFCATSLG